MIRMGLGVWVILVGLFSVTGTLTAAEYHYSYLPKHVYATQVFPVTLLVQSVSAAEEPHFEYHLPAPRPHSPTPTGIITVTTPTDPQTHSTLPIQSMPVKARNGSDIFYTFYFQAGNAGRFVVPPLTIREATQTHTLPSRSLPVLQLPPEANNTFYGLIATDYTLLASQVSTFDSNSTLVSLTFQAHEGNPEAIHIPGALEQGIEKITRKRSSVISEIYCVIPSTQTHITLSYYNPVQHRYIPTTIATDYHNKPVAAQVELNPKASPFGQLKKYGSIALAVFFVLMFWWKRDWLYFVLLIVLSFLIYTVYKPRPQLCIQEGSPLYILPTHNSRSSTTITKQMTTHTLGEHAGYNKINYRHGIIGWIRHEDLCKN